MARIPKDYYVKNEKTGCWNWYGHKVYGYGYLTRNYKKWRAHRWYYTLYKGEISRGKYLDHICRNKSCVNPSHLEPVTPAENKRRSPLLKLTHEKARKIRKLYANGSYKQKDLARVFNIGQDHVSRIVNNKQWATI